METITFVGRLRAVNLDTHRLQVTDDVGNKVALPDVAYDPAIGNLLGRYVTVVGTPERDSTGRLTQIHGATVQPAPPVPSAVGVRDAVELEDILESAPGAELGPIPGLTEDEAALYLKAIGL